MITYPMNSSVFMKQLINEFDPRGPEIDFAYDGSPTLTYDFYECGNDYSLEFGKLDEVPDGKWLLIQYHPEHREVWFFPTEDGGVTAQVMEPGGDKGRSWYHEEMAIHDFYNWVVDMSDTIWDLYYKDQYEEELGD